MSLLHIKRGEGGTLELYSSDTVDMCSRTERYVWKKMWAVGNDGGCERIQLSSVTWRKNDHNGSNQEGSCLHAYAYICLILASSCLCTQACIRFCVTLWQETLVG